jgi:hypothetical protein
MPAASAESRNFERRREALRSGPGWRTDQDERPRRQEPALVVQEAPIEREEPPPRRRGRSFGGGELPSYDEPSSARQDETPQLQEDEEQPYIDEDAPYEEAAPAPRLEERAYETEKAPTEVEEPPAADYDSEDDERVYAARPRQEERVEPIRTIPPTRGQRTTESLELAESFQQLRAQLNQIQRVATEGQRLLDTLAPQLEDLSSWIADLESVVNRWRTNGADEMVA